MPCETHYVGDGDEEVEVVDDLEEAAAMQDVAPRTPKRAPQDIVVEAASPTKTLKATAAQVMEPQSSTAVPLPAQPPPQCSTTQLPAQPPQCSTAQLPAQPPAAPSAPQQPTNSDLLQYMQMMFAKQESATDTVYKTLNKRLTDHDDNLGRLTKQIGDLNERLDNMELSGVGELNEATMRRLDAMEKNDKDLLHRLSMIEKDGKEATAKLAATIQEHQQQLPPVQGQVAGDVVQVQGFQRETPQGVIMKVYNKVIKPRLDSRFDMSPWDVRSPYMLSSQLHIKCSSPVQARQVVAALREAPLRCKAQGADVELYANLQKTQTQKDRSRRLMRMTAKILSFSTTTAKTTPTWKLVCWRSASIVVDNFRILKLDMNNKDITMSDGWWSSERFTSAQATIETAIRETLEEDLAYSRS